MKSVYLILIVALAFIAHADYVALDQIITFNAPIVVHFSKIKLSEENASAGASHSSHDFPHDDFPRDRFPPHHFPPVHFPPHHFPPDHFPPHDFPPRFHDRDFRGFASENLTEVNVTVNVTIVVPGENITGNLTVTPPEVNATENSTVLVNSTVTVNSTVNITTTVNTTTVVNTTVTNITVTENSTVAENITVAPAEGNVTDNITVTGSEGNTTINITVNPSGGNVSINITTGTLNVTINNTVAGDRDIGEVSGISSSFIEIQNYTVSVIGMFSWLVISYDIPLVGNSDLGATTRIILTIDDEPLYDATTYSSSPMDLQPLNIVAGKFNVTNGTHIIKLLAAADKGTLYIPSFNPNGIEAILSPSLFGRIRVFGM